MLLNALAARGLHYGVVSSVNNFDVQGPAFVSGVFEDVRLTDRNVVLARTKAEDPGLQIYNARSSNYATNLTIQTVGGPVTVLEGWASVDVRMRGLPVRFITTHLDAFVPQIRLAQATELLASATSTDLPIVLAGDLNTTTTTSTYAALTGAGFFDLWAQLHPSEAGFTCCEVLPAINNATPTLSERVDMMLFRGLLAPESISIVGASAASRTASGLWPSDHAGLAGRFQLEEHQ